MFNEDQLIKLNRLNTLVGIEERLSDKEATECDGLSFGYYKLYDARAQKIVGLPSDIAAKVYNYALDLVRADMRGYTIEIKGPSDV